VNIILRAVDVHKVYRIGSEDLEVLKGVSLEINRGDFIGIIGPSGVGKSTLLHILGALDEPSRGAVLCGDIDVYRLNDRKRSQFRNRRVGFVFQFYYLLPEFTALENVMMPAMIVTGGGKGRAGTVKERAETLLEEVGLAGRMKHRPNQLSGGEQQRVAIARALMNEPDLLLADEPTGNLDSHNSRMIVDLFLKLNAEKRQTTVLVTHDESLAVKTKKIVRMFDGKIQQIECL
jgi:lipoprotein-releasing system ATP-binding protein